MATMLIRNPVPNMPIWFVYGANVRCSSVPADTLADALTEDRTLVVRFKDGNNNRATRALTDRDIFLTQADAELFLALYNSTKGG